MSMIERIQSMDQKKHNLELLHVKTHQIFTQLKLKQRKKKRKQNAQVQLA